MELGASRFWTKILISHLYCHARHFSGENFDFLIDVFRLARKMASQRQSMSRKGSIYSEVPE